jgi:hypothetical protein
MNDGFSRTVLFLFNIEVPLTLTWLVCDDFSILQVCHFLCAFDQHFEIFCSRFDRNPPLTVPPLPAPPAHPICPISPIWLSSTKLFQSYLDHDICDRILHVQ